MTKEEEQTILDKYPNRIPIVLEPGDRHVSRLRSNKFLVPKDLTVGEFVAMVRRKLVMKPEQALYMSLEDGTMLNCSCLVVELYDTYKNMNDRHKGLTILYFTESTFG